VPNPKYIKGRNAEYAVMRILEKQGYVCTRSAGSHFVDIVAFMKQTSLMDGAFNKFLSSVFEELPLIRAISVKYHKAKPSKKEIQEVRDWNLPSIVSCELWHKQPRKDWEIINIRREQ